MAPEPVIWHRPEAQVWVQLAPAPHVTWHESEPLQSTRHELFSHVAWHGPFAGQVITQVPELQVHF